ncbi:MAG TPA: hypothetical protein DEB17_01595 [Chlorobaculum sp.]|uniref:Uncharacterized protein n=1 Tax=Chlorobaculum tepidum (strain ATCC 49652 / DSM 12025 / NBRC 103806 / TLS) TaxID=194439 RepID=Q8KDD4_CHLTE|nr:hypothetical protein CT1120 [Chlorobaculum tepidum TLS]HBU22692.1 hypothetical protein [Chlorobaculum sp.]
MNPAKSDRRFAIGTRGIVSRINDLADQPDAKETLKI